MHRRCIWPGRSLGASTLIQSLTVPVDFSAIIAESTPRDLAHPYDYLVDRFNLPPLVAGPVFWPLVEGFRWNAQLRYSVRLDRASPFDAIRQAHIPVRLIYGSADRLVPATQRRRLHEANLQYTTLWEVWLEPITEHRPGCICGLRVGALSSGSRRTAACGPLALLHSYEFNIHWREGFEFLAGGCEASGLLIDLEYH